MRWAVRSGPRRKGDEPIYPFVATNWHPPSFSPTTGLFYSCGESHSPARSKGVPLTYAVDAIRCPRGRRHAVRLRYTDSAGAGLGLRTARNASHEQNPEPRTPNSAPRTPNSAPRTPNRTQNPNGEVSTRKSEPQYLRPRPNLNNLQSPEDRCDYSDARCSCCLP